MWLQPVALSEQEVEDHLYSLLMEHHATAAESGTDTVAVAAE